MCGVQHGKVNTLRGSLAAFTIKHRKQRVHPFSAHRVLAIPEMAHNPWLARNTHKLLRVVKAHCEHSATQHTLGPSSADKPFVRPSSAVFDTAYMPIGSGGLHTQPRIEMEGVTRYSKKLSCTVTTRCHTAGAHLYAVTELTRTIEPPARMYGSASCGV